MFLIFFVCVSVVNAQFRYDNYTLYKIVPETDDHVLILNELKNSERNVDFWVNPSKVGSFVSVVVPPGEKEHFNDILNLNSFKYDITLEDVQEAIDNQTQTSRSKRKSRSLYWTNYQLLDDIYAWFDELASEYPNIVTPISAGLSYQGRQIRGLKISHGSNRRAFFLEGGYIGADWLSPVTLTYVIEQLLHGNDDETVRAARDFDWYIFPVINPDGYIYSQDAVRLWRKNRAPQTVADVGVDISKNWNSHWGVSGGSFTPSEADYVGVGPFSEPESRALSSFIELVGPELVAYLSFRAFGQRLIIPFAHTASPMYNYQDMITVGRRAMGSLAVRYGTQYLVGNSQDISDGATGASADWVKYRFNPPIAFTYLLRDTGNWGYTLPVGQVLPNCQEVMDSILAIIRESRFIGVF